MAKLYFYYAPMNAGKSTVLLQSNYNYKERGMNTILFSPNIDTRYGKSKITSRIGLQEDAVSIEEGMDLFQYTKDKKDKDPKLSCVLVDEVHFLKRKHVVAMVKIVDELNLPVLAYGLRSDYMGEPFESSLYLLTWADKLIELKTICFCGRKATMNMLVDDKGKKISKGVQFVIGGNEKYVSTCRTHFIKGKYQDDEENKTKFDILQEYNFAEDVEEFL